MQRTDGSMAAGVVDRLLARSLQAWREEHDAEWEERHPDGKQALWSSDAGHCPRRVWYSFFRPEAEEAPGPTSLSVLWMGDRLDEQIGMLVERTTPVARQVEVRLPVRGVEISGRIDLVIDPWSAERPQAKPLIVEIKTTSGRALKMMLSRKEHGREEHRLQLYTYLAAAQRGLVPEVPPEFAASGVLLYWVKDGGSGGLPPWYAIEVAYDPLQLQTALEPLLSLPSQTEPPPRPPGYSWSTWPCAWCPFRRTCWGVRNSDLPKI